MILNLYYFWFFLLLMVGMMFYMSGLYFLYFDLIIILDWEFVSLNSCSLVMTLLFDWMSMLFVGSVMFISSMVILYSNSYMSLDNNSLRFLFLIILFITSMCLMIMSPNLVSILLGWDGLGLVSYCLVIYYNNFNSYSAGMLTILINRVGDVSILLGIGIMFNYGSWCFLYYFFYDSGWGVYLFILSILAGFTSSAQMPFSSWLPAAMAAPTPVSALVHSSTLVTAGVYLLIRFSEFLFLYKIDLFLIISLLTMFMSGLGANFEFDMKSIIALSTLSQLGLMMSILFMGYPIVAFFHLLTHAFFKALLFLCAGLFIHSVNDTQDIRFMGGFVNNFPYTSACFGVSNFSLCGLPFLSGFYSSDLILELMIMSWFNLFIIIIFYISIGLTVCYSFRLCYYCMLNKFNLSTYNLYGEDYNMTISMLSLVLMGIVKGSMLMWLIFPFPDLTLMPNLFSVFPLLLIFMGGLLGYEFNFFYDLSFFGLKYPLTYNFMINMWFMPFFSTYMIYSPSYSLSLNYIKFFDSGWGEFLISGFFVKITILISKINAYIQNNNLSIFFCSFIFFTYLIILI
uniref:NADH dehydrogenase subunit 5 n=1 Tax=Capodemus sinuatus TaxID=2969366 RepID=UPI002176BCD8|nr:NADH dehydrogenase subunit 5 [Capodemus sinuatus]UUJ37732.1 NADH dehydrogenase subunit 5 [Capodemus sinuatus]